MHDDYGAPFSLTAQTQTIAAALAANSIVFAAGAVANVASTPNILRGPLTIAAMRMRFTAIVGSAAALLVGRCLQVFKASNNAQAMPTGGATAAPIAKRTLNTPADNGLIGGLARVATTGALTAGTFTRGTVPLATLDLASSGALGAVMAQEWQWQVTGAPVILDPGEIVCVSNPAVFDLLLTWQLTVELDYYRRDSV